MTTPTFCIVRILGNELPKLHDPGQTEQNLRYLLQHNQLPAEVMQMFVLNRIVNNDTLNTYWTLLDKYRCPCRNIPFEREQWDALPILTAQVREQLKVNPQSIKQVRVRERLLQPYSNCLININSARNAALDWAREQTDCEWILLLDGNCYFNRHQWQSLQESLWDDNDYLLIPLVQLPTWERAAPQEPPSTLTNRLAFEPQLAFHRTRSTIAFNEAIAYGASDKAELLRVITNGRLAHDPQHVWTQWRDNERVLNIPDRDGLDCNFQLLSSVYRLPRWQEKPPQFSYCDPWDREMLLRLVSYFRSQALLEMIICMQKT